MKKASIGPGANELAGFGVLGSAGAWAYRRLRNSDF
jgi:hypothetical protein